MPRVSMTVLLATAFVCVGCVMWQQHQLSINELGSEIRNLRKQIQEEHSEQVKKQNYIRMQYLEPLQNEQKLAQDDRERLLSAHENLKNAFLEERNRTLKLNLHLSLLVRFRINVTTTMQELQANMIRLVSRIEAYEKKSNESLIEIVEFFVDEITELKNKTLSFEEQLRRLESREPVMIENKVVVENKQYHHAEHREYHVQKMEPTWTLGGMIGGFVGGIVEKGVNGLVSAARSVIGW